MGEKSAKLTEKETKPKQKKLWYHKFLHRRSKIEREIQRRRAINPDYDELCEIRHEIAKEKLELEKMELKAEKKEFQISTGEIAAPKVDGVQDILELVKKDRDMKSTHKALLIGAIQIFGPMLQTPMKQAQKIQPSEIASPVVSPSIETPSPESIIDKHEQQEFNAQAYLELIPQKYHVLLANSNVVQLQTFAREKGYQFTPEQAQQLINAAKGLQTVEVGQ